jgi:hypothetical protein
VTLAAYECKSTDFPEPPYPTEYVYCIICVAVNNRQFTVFNWPPLFVAIKFQCPICKNCVVYIYIYIFLPLSIATLDYVRVFPKGSVITRMQCKYYLP